MTMEGVSAPPTWVLAALVAPAVVAGASAVASSFVRTSRTAWRVARTAPALMGVAAVVMLVARVTDGASADGLVRLDSVTVAMLLLISLIGWVVVRYSTAYVAGDPLERRYVPRLLAVLAAVGVVVTTNHLLVLVAAWAGASIALHGLLTHFGDRPVALAVAHKKFLLARCADVAMLGAVAAFATSYDTLRIDAIGAAAADGLPTGARIGIFLVAVAAMLKCAQLPFHGWLMQVMEAPTPVSALLHAGVVNLGGFVLLRFAPVVDGAVETRTALVVVGVFTAVVASLVMTTRVSVKVALAWSTSAQMGFMLVQCGLGLWEMALLHLLAHSGYKAHAFLGAGGTVLRTQRRRLAPAATAPSAGAVAVGAAVAAAGTVVVGVLWQLAPSTKDLTATVWLMLGVVALAIVPVTLPGRAAGVRTTATRLGRALLVPVAYLALHELMARIVPEGSAAPAALLVLTGAGFAVLFLLQSACLVAPEGRLAQRIRPWIYAGLFLDDAFTRVAFAVSAPPAAAERPALLPRPAATAVVRTGRHASAAAPAR